MNHLHPEKLHELGLALQKQFKETQSVRDLRQSSKAGHQLANTIVQDANIKVRSNTDANRYLAKYVSQLLALEALCVQPAKHGEHKVQSNIKPAANGLYGEYQDTFLCQFLELTPANIKTVTSLQLGDWTLTAAAAQLLVSRFPSISCFQADIFSSRGSQAKLFQTMSQWKNLRSVTLDAPKPQRPLELSSMSQLTQVTELNVKGYDSDTLGALSRMTNLKSLSLPEYSGAEKEESDFPSALQHLTGLKHLNVGQLDQADLDALSASSVLTSLYFKHIGGASLPALPSVTEIRGTYAQSIAQVLAVCPSLSCVHVSKSSQGTWDFSCSLFTTNGMVEELQGLAAINDWKLSGRTSEASARSLDAHVLYIDCHHLERQAWNVLRSPSVAAIQPIYLFTRLHLHNLNLTQDAIDLFIVRLFPSLTHLSLNKCEFVNVTSLMSLRSLPLVYLRVLGWGISEYIVAALTLALEMQRPGQVQIEVRVDPRQSWELAFSNSDDYPESYSEAYGTDNDIGEYYGDDSEGDF